MIEVARAEPKTLEGFQKKTIQTMNLHQTLTKTYVQIKHPFQATLDQIFSEYQSVFSNMDANTKNATQKELAAEMQKRGARRQDAPMRGFFIRLVCYRRRLNAILLNETSIKVI